MQFIRDHRKTRKLSQILLSAVLVTSASLMSVPAFAGDKLGAIAHPSNAKIISPDRSIVLSGEPELNVTGPIFNGAESQNDLVFAEGIKGMVDAHTHVTTHEAFGGNMLCGETFSPLGAAHALMDCDYHFPDGTNAIIENFNTGKTSHDPAGWPVLKDWPSYDTVTHQQMYYRWIERSWRSGQRLLVSYMTNNSVLCTLPLQNNENACDDMDSVRVQTQKNYALEAYIDQQYGGPGKGWFRIVKSPEEARDMILQGKLAVILGVEASEPFGCSLTGDTPNCDIADIDAGLDEWHDLGIRVIYLCHKYDNALCGIRFDGGDGGTFVNIGNKTLNGNFWEAEACPDEFTDNTLNVNDVILPDILAVLAGVDIVPGYGPGPHCNIRGLTDLGEHALRGMVDRNMMLDIDHMSVKGAKKTFSIFEELGYPGIISSHGWMNNKFTERLYKLGGFKTYYASRAESIVPRIAGEKALRKKYNKGLGFGFDFNGFAGGHSAPLPEGTPDRVIYPFTGIDGRVVIDRQVSGERVFDFSNDGLAHYGLVPDYIEDIRVVGGDEAVEDFIYGAASYLRTWKTANDFEQFSKANPIAFVPFDPFLATTTVPVNKKKRRRARKKRK